MLGKYINQFMADNELSVNEEFFIKNMDGNRIWERMQVIPDLCAYNWHKLYQHLMDNAKNYVLAEPSEDINCGILSRNPVNWKLNKVHVIRLINQ